LYTLYCASSNKKSSDWNPASLTYSTKEPEIVDTTLPSIFEEVDKIFYYIWHLYDGSEEQDRRFQEKTKQEDRKEETRRRENKKQKEEKIRNEEKGNNQERAEEKNGGGKRVTKRALRENKYPMRGKK